MAILDLRPHGVINLSLTPSEPLVIKGTIRALPLVEGDYSVGLYLNTDAVRQNFMDLASIEVLSDAAQSHIPYPAVHRGHIELDFTAAPDFKKGNS